MRSRQCIWRCMVGPPLRQVEPACTDYLGFVLPHCVGMVLHKPCPVTSW